MPQQRNAQSPLLQIERELTLGENAYAQLKQVLINGMMGPGERVTVRGVASALGVSITPAREAITKLVSEGALAAIGPKTIVVPTLTTEILDEVTNLRLALEPNTARIGAAKKGKRSLAFLRSTQKALKGAMSQEDYREVLQRNHDFHFELYEAAGLPMTLGFIESLWMKIGPSLNLLYPEFAVHRGGLSNHADVISAISSGDTSKVENAIRRDIEMGYESLSNYVANTNRMNQNR